MCGLVGMAGMGIGTVDMKTMHNLLSVCMLRGTHSTGLFQTNHKREDIRITKGAVDAQTFMTGIGKTAMMDAYPTVHMAHCRDATIGDVNDANAHPFDTGRFVGMHNGTLTDYKYLHKNKTDSQMMFEDMEEGGVEGVLSELDFWSAYAVTIWDKQEKELIFARNTERPLHVAVDKQYDIIYWASEAGMLDFVLDRRKVRAEVFYVPSNTIFRTKIDDIKAGENAPWTTTEIRRKPSSKKVHRAFGYGWGYDDNEPWEIEANNQTFTKPERTSFKEFVDEVANKAGEASKSCCVCGTLLEDRPAVKTSKDGHTYESCIMCSQWIEDLDPETGEIKVRQNV